MKKRLDKLEKYRNVKDFKLLIVEKVGDNLYQNIKFTTETFTLEELEELEVMNLTEYQKEFMAKRTKAIEKYLFDDPDDEV
jgi:Ni2+-binding GTPase involved in maturation of urease and hydrogenase